MVGIQVLQSPLEVEVGNQELREDLASVHPVLEVVEYLAFLVVEEVLLTYLVEVEAHQRSH